MSVLVRLKQEDARPDGRCDMRPSQLIKDYILTKCHILAYVDIYM